MASSDGGGRKKKNDEYIIGTRYMYNGTGVTGSSSYPALLTSSNCTLVVLKMLSGQVVVRRVVTTTLVLYIY